MAKILVVDDEKQIRDMLTQILTRAKHEVELAEDGVIALQKYRASTFDLIITDLMMAKKNGLELIREISQEFGEVRVIAISGGMPTSPSDYYLSVAKLMGASKILDKPFTKVELLAAVDALLAQE
ncbi:MAG: response regulator [Gammaproteobacteria bacterium]|nr:response regulator [Gammaproteobacteria bacterium]MCF6231019.1 response regulator [Gammaproteobacteria bacterium]